MLTVNPVTYTWNAYTISTDRSRLDLGFVHDYLKRSYWASGVPYTVVVRSVENSLPFGVYQGAQQVGFARVITDFSTLVYLADVFIIEEHQGQGLGKWLIQSIKTHPDLQAIRRWLLFTRDAHGLYEQFGFERTPGVEDRLMSWSDPTYATSNVRREIPSEQ